MKTVGKTSKKANKNADSDFEWHEEGEERERAYKKWSSQEN